MSADSELKVRTSQFEAGRWREALQEKKKKKKERKHNWNLYITGMCLILLRWTLQPCRGS